MAAYSESYARELLAAISELTGDALDDFAVEVHDAGSFLLITASPQKKLTQSQFDEIEEKVRNYLGARIPKREGDYAWMLTVLGEGIVVGTILPDMA